MSDKTMEFILNVQHDIRAPLTGVWSLASYLSSHETDIEKTKSLESIVESVKSILDYCDAMLDSAKAEHNGLMRDEEEFNLKVLIDNILAMIVPAAEHKGLDLISNYLSDSSVVLIGDSNGLKRILINLLSNAIKYTQKGYVKVKAQLTQLGDSRVMLILHIEDSGIGIPEDQQSFIYEKFVSLGTSNEYSSSGIGLYAVKQIIQKMQGTILLESKLGQGTKFVCSLPFKTMKDIIPLVDR